MPFTNIIQDVGPTVEISEIETLAKGTIIVGDGSGAPTTFAAGADNKPVVYEAAQTSGVRAGGKILVDEAEIDGDLNHDGSSIGFFAVAPTTRATAITQTYATADKTHANFTSADLATTAATQTTPFGFATGAQADNIATQFNLLRADVADAKQLLNSVIDDLQAYGLLQ